MNRSFCLVLFAAISLCIVETEAQEGEVIDPHVLIQEYNHVFKVKGNPIVISRAAAVVAAEDRLRVLLHIPPDASIDLSAVRNLSQPELVRIMFHAVAGVYAKHQCPFLIDVDTGALEPVDDNKQNESVLIGMCVTLLCVIAVMKLKTKELTSGS